MPHLVELSTITIGLLPLTLSKELRKIQNQIHGLDYAYYHQQLIEKLGHFFKKNI
jgi:hypothetical protein